MRPLPLHQPRRRRAGVGDAVPQPRITADRPILLALRPTRGTTASDLPEPCLVATGAVGVRWLGWEASRHTLRLLMTRPGQLTVDFLEGKRARYISPVRLYLSASVVYFLLATSATGGLKMSINPGAARGADASVPVVGNSKAIEEADRRELLARIDSLPAIFRPVVLKFAANPLGFQKDIFDALPKVLFALLPVFAGIVALFYRRRHFAAHLYFAIHLHAFAFVAMSLAALAASVPSSALRLVVGIARVALDPALRASRVRASVRWLAWHVDVA